MALSAITTLEEVSRLHVLFERLFRERVGFSEGLHHDLVGHDEKGKPLALPQIFEPSNFSPDLRNTQFRANALAIAKQLLGEEAIPYFEHAILKPAHYGALTPWHQDEAHGSDSGWEQVSFWMPLQEATLENGCMHYIPALIEPGFLTTPRQAMTRLSRHLSAEAILIRLMPSHVRCRPEAAPFIMEGLYTTQGQIGRPFQGAPTFGGAFKGAPPSPWLDHYVEMAHEAVT